MRLSRLPHILALRAPLVTLLPPVGSVVENCAVIWIDPGVGALLALPDSNANSASLNITNVESSKSIFPILSQDESFLQAQRVQAVYVHIFKALDESDENSGETVSAVLFAKTFGPSTKHTVRIVGTGNLVGGVASGATAPNLLHARVLTRFMLAPLD